jgi:hypothetical protein
MLGTRDPLEGDLEMLEFLADGVVPERVAVVFPTDSDTGERVTSMPPTLVAVVDEARWPAALQATIWELRAVRTEHPGEEWQDAAHYGIGWSTLFRTGKPREILAAVVKVKLEVVTPVMFKQAFIFDLTQTLSAIKQVVDGGIFAIATTSELEHLDSPESSYASLLEMLPVFVLPQSEPIAGLIEVMEKASREDHQ